MKSLRPTHPSTNTKLTKCTGWAPKGERFRTHAPFGKWQTQTFIAGLRCHGLVVPWIVNAPMNAAIFERYVETQLAPELSPGDVVILDMSASTRASAPNNWSAKGAPDSCSCGHTRPISTRSRWPSRNSRRDCERRRPEPSTHSAKLSAISATCSSQPNAETSSRLPDMRPVNRDTL